MYFLLLFHCNNGCHTAPHCYVIRTLCCLPIVLLLHNFVSIRVKTECDGTRAETRFGLSAK